MPRNYLEKVCCPDQKVNPLFAFLGIEVEALQPERARLRLHAKPDMIQGAGMVAGGVLATLLDEAMAHAVLAGNAPREKTTTVDMNVSYLRPVAVDTVLICEARVIKRGKRVAFAEAVIRDLGSNLENQAGPGQEAARATATFLMV
ncbi:MAG: PaaI family thioesterase [Pseudodesulfovibrio sp.]|uniref:Thioesterase superfamily protein n=1 Tax=Pseudodesulfovibrio aespoeensis (strain ATCC 700646 / DSM 10631 / Aspo-2) TaxID=643562 RepID=E6VV27_PSEA9|nr:MULTISPECIES: PaaI family thioesterase [Pseudodesulfovibrio]MBU4192742.1 PaaI family thioesterase [Pseudomonadota bacterium]ADU61178.1 thioesterase superfamily protein [Pseudodesulfovibrio aespoeensis Aspo-2]MBU4244857.1 PaaI family thioesterase [Pseudomonadota bacterium]MBU4379408.1 PaaI family thioesterase [Pseudomonadota bacterium]MBU4476629.1 PaaI family thioesterase [Pseudomonadota bacterium]